MIKTPVNANKKPPSFRLAGCGDFPDYRINGIPLKDKNILYLISVGTKKFEGKWIERFVNFAKEMKPKKVLIVVADSLQRFNIELEENLSEISAFEESKKRGQKWIEDYKSKFSDLGKENEDYEFITWEKLKENDDYQIYFNEIMVWNESDDFKQLLLDSAKAYMNRFNRKENQSRAIEQSSKFLNEECAVIRVLAKEQNTIGIFYPGAPLKIFDYIISHANKSRPLNPFFYIELHPTKIRHKKKQTDEKLNSVESAPFFKSKKLSINHESENECVLPSSKPFI